MWTWAGHFRFGRSSLHGALFQVPSLLGTAYTGTVMLSRKFFPAHVCGNVGGEALHL